jgi:HEAT repeat protein
MSRRQLTYVLGLLALAVLGGLVGGWVSPSDRSSAGRPTRTVAVGGTSMAPSTSAGGHATSYTKQADPDSPARLAEALSSPDSRVRIRALETWAQHPGEDLNPVTYALVDPDESVRARAQEVLEAVLARR